MTEEKKDPKLTKQQEKALVSVMADINGLVDDMEELVAANGGRPISREFALVFTKLEEAEMWCERGFARLGYELDSVDDEEEDEAGDDEEE